MTDTSAPGLASSPAAFDGSLLAADFAARDLLIDVRSADAPAMLRSWGDVVASAAVLWRALPGGAGNQTMTRLAEMAGGLDRSHVQSGWPRAGAPDERLARISESLSRATDQIHVAGTAVASSGEISSTHGAAGDAARTRILHTLYVTAHALGVAVREHLREEGRRPKETSRTLDAVGPAILGRLYAFEQIAGAELGISSDPARSDAPTTSGGRLRNALIHWDIQAHRALATTPTAGTLVMINRVQASLATTSYAVLSAAAETGHLDPDIFTHRLAPALDRTQRGWSKLAVRWSELTSPTALGVGAGITLAAAQLRAAMLDVASDTNAAASAAVMATRADLGATSRELQQALSAAVDIAHIVRDVAAGHTDLSGPARVMSRRANDEAEIRGPTISGVWVPVRDVHANRLVPIPLPARAGLVGAAEDTIHAAASAMFAAAALDRLRATLDPGRGTAERGALGLGRPHSDRSLPAGSAPSPVPNW